MTISPTNSQPLVLVLFALADDKLMLGHRSSDWTGLGPILEEDIAFSHLAQDEIAHAQAIYEFIGPLAGRNADQLAFGRTADEYRCASIVEIPDEFDWATALTRKFFCDHFDLLRLERLSQSSNADLAALAARIADEERLHVQHVNGWMSRLGQGTAESRERLQRAIDALAPHGVMLFETVEGQAELETNGVYPGSNEQMFAQWSKAIKTIIAQAGLMMTLPALDPEARGGRHGIHAPHFAAMLDEMCEVYRVEPDAAW